MPHGKVVGIFISEAARQPMTEVQIARALEGKGLEGDRYASGEGSYSKGEVGRRQVTFINSIFFDRTSFTFAQSRRNIVTDGTELMDLIGKEFQIGDARFLGVKYCDPCHIPSKLAAKSEIFRTTFFDRGGLIADVVEMGTIRVGDTVVPPRKNYRT